MSAQTSTTPTGASKFGVFAITFGIAFTILYTVCVSRNWPLFTYHPAVNKIDLFWHPGRSGEGPPMHWYGWLALCYPVAAVVGWIATMISSQQLYRATVFCCVLAAFWPALFWVGGFIADRASFDAEFLKSVWVSAIPALAGAAAVGYFIPSQWAQRLWPGWLLIMPIGAFVLLGYSLTPLFLR
jgi:hypothetical protein